MSERRSAADLGSSTEALLAAFPFPERDWESDARAIEARFAEAGPTDALLLAAPLPAEPGEPNGTPATATPLTNSGVRTQSLAELARRSVEKKQAEQREMARASLAIAAKKPAPNAPSAARAVDSRAVETPALDSRAVECAARPPLPPATRADSAPSAWPKLTLGVSLLALAAAALLWLRRPAEPAPLTSNTLPTAISQAKPTTTSATAAAAPTVAAAHDIPSQAPSIPQGIDPNTLPNEGPAKPAEAVAHAPAPAAAGAVVASSPAARSKAGKIVSEEQPSPLAAAPSPATEKIELGLPPDPGLRPADSSGGQLPVKPSSGAVQAALGAVLSGARHCVAGDDAPSSAVVLFGSDGRVQSVSVSGPAAGKAAGQCIQAQLTKARVQPFAASNFSVNTTIRPD